MHYLLQTSQGGTNSIIHIFTDAETEKGNELPKVTQQVGAGARNKHGASVYQSLDCLLPQGKSAKCNYQLAWVAGKNS